MSWQDMVARCEAEFDIDILYDNEENLLLGIRTPEDEPILGLVFIVDVSPDDAADNLSTTFIRQVVLPPSFLWRLLRHDFAQPLVSPSEDLVFRRERNELTLSLKVTPDESLEVKLNEEQTEELLEAADVFGDADPEADVVPNLDGSWSVASFMTEKGHRLGSPNRMLMNAMAAEICAGGHDPEELSIANLVIAAYAFADDDSELPEAISAAIDASMAIDDFGHRQFQKTLLKKLAEEFPEVASVKDTREAYTVAFRNLSPALKTFLTVLHENLPTFLELSLGVALGLIPAHVMIESCCAEFEPDSDDDFATRHNLSILLDYLALTRLATTT